jgi:hypothetical protein
MLALMPCPVGILKYQPVAKPERHILQRKKRLNRRYGD